jgi:hypothetical protein
MGPLVSGFLADLSSSLLFVFCNLQRVLYREFGDLILRNLWKTERNKWRQAALFPEVTQTPRLSADELTDADLF